MKITEDIFDQLHVGLANRLLQTLQDGTATAADLSIIRQFLKDNRIEGVPVAASPLGTLASMLPDFDAEENADIPHH